MIELRVGWLKLQKGSTPACYHVVTPCHPPPEGEDPWASVYTAAFLKRDHEGWTMETVGKRPWEMHNATPQEFMDFCLVALNLLEKIDHE